MPATQPTGEFWPRFVVLWLVCPVCLHLALHAFQVSRQPNRLARADALDALVPLVPFAAVAVVLAVSTPRAASKNLQWWLCVTSLFFWAALILPWMICLAIG